VLARTPVSATASTVRLPARSNATAQLSSAAKELSRSSYPGPADVQSMQEIEMALNAYLRLKGQRTGDIRGSVTQKGREGTIMVIAVDHELSSPRDPSSGLPTGKLRHKPVRITKELDRSSPLLYQMMTTNENLTGWELQFWRMTAAGTEIQNFTMRLTNANIADIEFHMPNNKNPDLMKYAEFEEVSFTYQRIDWTWNEGGITATADWATL
jgi:type VI secretion system secreted protein Hcp